MPKISLGRFLTHLAQQYAKLADCLEQDGDLEQALKALKEDKVYRALDGFVSPVQQCATIANLTKQVVRVEQAIGPFCTRCKSIDPNQAREFNEALQPYVATVRGFLDSYSPDWGEKSYVIIPVSLSVEGEQQTEKQYGLTYLRRFNPDDDAGAGWKVVGLAPAPRKAQPNRTYFDELANVCMGVLYGTDWEHPHADPWQLRRDHVYKLLFGCVITKGHSHGGAILAQFALSYLYSTLGANYLHHVSPVPGTLISAVVEPNGEVSSVEDENEKVLVALNEFGHDIRVILPKTNCLSAEVKARLDPERVFYASNAEQLINYALFSNNQHNLDELRARLRQLLNIPTWQAVLARLRPEVSPQMLQRGVNYNTHPNGVLSRVELQRPRLRICLGFEEAAFAPPPRQQPRLEILAIDGSAQMDAAWEPGPRSICRVTELVFGVAERLAKQADAGRHADLSYAFLSTKELRPIIPGTPALQIEAELQRLRDSERLRYRGAFLRPLAERLATTFHDRTKRVFVLSDGQVFDYEDAEENFCSAKSWLTFQPQSVPGRISLCLPNSSLRDEVLDDYFAHPSDVFSEVCVNLGKSIVPVLWEPATGVLSRQDTGELLLTFPLANEASFDASIQLTHNSDPTELALHAKMIRRGKEVEFRFHDYVVPAECPVLTQPPLGQLSDIDFQQWQQIGTGSQECHRFASLPGDPDRFYLLFVGKPEWYSFQTGIELGELVLVIMGGIPYWVPPDGILQPLQAREGCFLLARNGHDPIVVVPGRFVTRGWNPDTEEPTHALGEPVTQEIARGVVAIHTSDIPRNSTEAPAHAGAKSRGTDRTPTDGEDANSGPGNRLGFPHALSLPAVTWRRLDRIAPGDQNSGRAVGD